MPQTKFQQVFYSVLTVIITVHLFVFYNLAIEMGGMSNQVFIASIKVVPVEFVFAILLQLFIAGPLSKKLAFSIVDPRIDRPVIVSTVMICSTIFYMCPLMSLISAVLFHGFTSELIAVWFQNIVFNLPFAFFTQIFFVQPFVRFVFGLVFKNQLNQNQQPASKPVEA